MINFLFSRRPAKRRDTKKPVNAEKIIENGLSCDLEENIKLFKKLFDDDDTFIIREVENRYNPDIHCCLMFLDGMIDVNIINESIIRPITTYSNKIKGDLFNVLCGQIIQSNSVDPSDDITQLLETILYGDNLKLTVEICADPCHAVFSDDFSNLRIAADIANSLIIKVSDFIHLVHGDKTPFPFVPFLTSADLIL